MTFAQTSKKKQTTTQTTLHPPIYRHHHHLHISNALDSRRPRVVLLFAVLLSLRLVLSFTVLQHPSHKSPTEQKVNFFFF